MMDTQKADAVSLVPNVDAAQAEAADQQGALAVDSTVMSAESSHSPESAQSPASHASSTGDGDTATKNLPELPAQSPPRTDTVLLEGIDQMELEDNNAEPLAAVSSTTSSGSDHKDARATSAPIDNAIAEDANDAIASVATATAAPVWAEIVDPQTRRLFYVNTATGKARMFACLVQHFLTRM